MTYAQNVRAILECCFSQSKDEIITTATNAILALKSEPVVINPVTTPTYPITPYYTTPDTPITTTPGIVCGDKDNGEFLKNQKIKIIIKGKKI